MISRFSWVNGAFVHVCTTPTHWTRRAFQSDNSWQPGDALVLLSRLSRSLQSCAVDWGEASPEMACEGRMWSWRLARAAFWYPKWDPMFFLKTLLLMTYFQWTHQIHRDIYIYIYIYVFIQYMNIYMYKYIYIYIHICGGGLPIIIINQPPHRAGYLPCSNHRWHQCLNGFLRGRTSVKRTIKFRIFGAFFLQNKCKSVLGFHEILMDFVTQISPEGVLPSSGWRCFTFHWQKLQLLANTS